jgi:hypothetical protein
MTLGLGDVLLDPETNQLFTPNTGITTDLKNIGKIDE